MAAIYRAKITSNGRVTIPVEIRDALGFRPGNVVVFEILDGHVAIRLSEHNEHQSSKSQPND